MVFKKFVFSMCSFFGLRERQRIIKSSSLLDRANVSSIQDGVVHDDEAPLNSSGGSKVQPEAADEGNEFCCICLSRMRERAETRSLPCRHEFHRACIDTWLKACRKTCPICRFVLKNEEKTPIWEELTEEMVIWFSSFHAAGF